MEGSSQPFSQLSCPSSPSRPNEPSSPGAEKTTKTLPKQSEKRGETNAPITSLIRANWPSLPLESGIPIQPGQAAKATSQQTSPWKIQQKDPEEYEKDLVGKFAEYFKGNEILPIPEILEKLEPRIVSLVVTDIKTRRLVGLKKEGFEDLIRKADVPCQYFCRRSFATWDALLPSSKQAAMVASSNIMTKFSRRQPEYLGTRRIRVTVCNVLALVTGEVLATFLSAYGRVEEINLLRSAAGTAYRICQTLQLLQPPQLLQQQQQSPQTPSAAKAKLKIRSRVRPAQKSRGRLDRRDQEKKEVSKEN